MGWTAAPPAAAEDAPRPAGPRKKPSKRELAAEAARKKEEERRKLEEARRAEASHYAAELKAAQVRAAAKAALAAESSAMFRESAAAFLDGRRYFEEVRRERRRAEDELAGTRAASAHGLLALPIIFYSPETNLGLGAFGLYYFHLGDAEKTRASNLRSSFTYTTKKQALFDIGPNLWFSENRLNTSAVFSYEYYPNFFAGIGNRTPATLIESYTERSLNLNLQAQVKLAGDLFAGLRYRYENRAILETAPGRALDLGEVLGTNGGALSGLGVTVSYDSRDNLDAPAKGAYAYLAVRQNFRAIGSDYKFTEVDIDLRKYVGLGPTVLAMQLLGSANAGDAPFYALSTIGGRKALRGISNGRFRDTYLTQGQVDWRFPIWGPWSGATFFGAGEVMHTIPDWSPKGLHPAGGAGIRYAIVPSERLRIRLDFAYAESGLAYYLDISEAF